MSTAPPTTRDGRQPFAVAHRWGVALLVLALSCLLALPAAVARLAMSNSTTFAVPLPQGPRGGNQEEVETEYVDEAFPPARSPTRAAGPRATRAARAAAQPISRGVPRSPGDLIIASGVYHLPLRC